MTWIPAPLRPAVGAVVAIGGVALAGALLWIHQVQAAPQSVDVYAWHGARTPVVFQCNYTPLPEPDNPHWSVLHSRLYVTCTGDVPPMIIEPLGGTQ